MANLRAVAAVLIPLVSAGAFGTAAFAETSGVRQIPDEYETTSGYGVAMNNAGAAATDGFSAVRTNPALLTASKQYTVNGGYHWPSAGREFFQAGVIDSKTSPVAVGVTYTGFTENYTASSPNATTAALASASPYDSPVIRRGVIGVAETFGGVSLGAGGTYVEANALDGSVEKSQGQTTVKGFGINLGASTNLSSSLALGASVENASNQKIKDYDPMTYRAGVAYHATQSITGYFDLRQRDRVVEFEGDYPSLFGVQAPQTSKLMSQPERLAIGSVAAQVQEIVRLLGSYGQSLTDPRRMAAAGIALASKSFSFSYTISRPYMAVNTTHQAITLSLDMAM